MYFFFGKKGFQPQKTFNGIIQIINRKDFKNTANPEINAIMCLSTVAE